MPQVQSVRFRVAGAADATAIAALHADSWRRHYRGVYSDSFLDGDVEQDRRTVWSKRLAVTTSETVHTVVAEDDDGLVGFTHVVFDADPEWGALLDNLRVEWRIAWRGHITSCASPGRIRACCCRPLGPAQSEQSQRFVGVWLQSACGLRQSAHTGVDLRERGGNEALASVHPPPLPVSVHIPPAGGRRPGRHRGCGSERLVCESRQGDERRDGCTSALKAWSVGF
jgi:hypothetical protein